MKFFSNLILALIKDDDSAKNLLLSKIKSSDQHHPLKKIKSFDNPKNGDLNALMLFVRKHGDDPPTSTLYLNHEDLEQFLSFSDLSYESKLQGSSLLLELCLAHTPIKFTDNQWDRIIQSADLTKSFSLGEENVNFSPTSYLLSSKNHQQHIPMHIAEKIINKTIELCDAKQLTLLSTKNILSARNTLAKNLTKETTLNLIKRTNLNQQIYECPHLESEKYNFLSFALKHYQPNLINLNQDVFEYLVKNTDLSQIQPNYQTALEIFVRHYNEDLKISINKETIDYLFKHSPPLSKDQTSVLHSEIHSIISQENIDESLITAVFPHYIKTLSISKEQFVEEVALNEDLHNKINQMQEIIKKQEKELKYQHFLTPHKNPKIKL